MTIKLTSKKGKFFGKLKSFNNVFHDFLFSFAQLRIDVNGYRFVAICCLYYVNPHDDMTIQIYEQIVIYLSGGKIDIWLTTIDFQALRKWREISNVLIRHQEFNMF